MPSTVERHYDEFLSDHYDWMFGVSYETKIGEQKALLQDLVGTGIGTREAIDLGCGSGFQSIALAELGYQVVAVDTCEKLLDELKKRIAGRSVSMKLADIRQLERITAPGSADLIVCMGDTITHLPSRADVCNLLRSVAVVLRPGGSLVLTYRDLSAVPKVGPDRFILVHGDAHRVMTCYLEDSSADTVIVNDLLHELGKDLRWTLRTSCYPKLKLPATWIEDQLRQLGFLISESREGRMKILVAKTPVKI